MHKPRGVTRERERSCTTLSSETLWLPSRQELAWSRKKSAQIPQKETETIMNAICPWLAETKGIGHWLIIWLFWLWLGAWRDVIGDHSQAKATLRHTNTTSKHDDDDNNDHNDDGQTRHWALAQPLCGLGGGHMKCGRSRCHLYCRVSRGQLSMGQLDHWGPVKLAQVTSCGKPDPVAPVDLSI